MRFCITSGDGVGQHYDRTDTCSRCEIELPFEVGGIPNSEGLSREAHRARSRLGLFEFLRLEWTRQIPKDADAGESRHELLQEFDAFGANVLSHVDEARNLAAWPREARRVPCRHEVARNCDDDRDGSSRLLDSTDRGVTVCDDDVHLELDELGSERL